MDCGNRRGSLPGLLWGYCVLFRDFHIICLVLAAGGDIFGGSFCGGLLWKHHPKKVPLWLSVSAVTFLLASMVIFCVVEIFIFLGAAGANTPNLDYVIVLGAKVEEGRVSNSLQMRLDRAYEYSRRNPGDRVLSSPEAGGRMSRLARRR